MAIPYNNPIDSLKDKTSTVLTIRTNAGEKQIPNVAWLVGYVDNKISGGGSALDSYLTKDEAENTYAKKEDIPNIDINNYVKKEVAVGHRRLWIDQTAEYLSIYAQNEDEVTQSNFNITLYGISMIWENGDHTIKNILKIGEEGLFYNDSSLITGRELDNNYYTKTDVDELFASITNTSSLTNSEIDQIITGAYLSE